MISANLQYKVDDQQEATTVELKTLPREGEYIQYNDKPFKVAKVYHIPGVINQVENSKEADVILFGEFVSGSELSDF